MSLASEMRPSEELRALLLRVYAARINALALGGEILASDLVYALARGLGTFTFGQTRNAALKGLDGSFELYPVLA